MYFSAVLASMSTGLVTLDRVGDYECEFCASLGHQGHDNDEGHEAMKAMRAMKAVTAMNWGGLFPGERICDTDVFTEIR